MNKNVQDLAWSVLPKEFKEEVKKEYRKWFNEPWWGSGYLRGRLRILRELFGEHNLTSDSEGEVELLHVTRQKVMGLYANAKKLHDLYTSATCINEAESRTIDHTDGAMGVLKNLFGSKCLPDNVDSSEPNVESLDANVDSSKPKPAKPQFTKGDMVHCKSLGYEGDYKVIEYTGGPRNCYDCIDKYGAYYRFYESDLEPYTEPDTSHETPVCENHSDKTSQKAEKEVMRMKPIKAKVRVYLATKEEDEEFRLLLHENGFIWNSGDSLIDSSMWESDIESAKIHFFHPDKTVTYGGNKTPDTLTFSEFKKQYFGEETSPNVNRSDINIDELVAKGYVADPAKQLDNILKDSFRNERRLNIATRIMSAILSNQRMLNNLAHGETTAEGAVRCVVDATMMYTDALITECEKGGSHEKA